MNFILFFLLKIVTVLTGILISPILYLYREKTTVWNKNQDLPYDIKKPLGYVWGNMEDGIYFDPYVYKKLNKKFKRGTFRDFFEWNILRNPTHNLEEYLGVDLKDLIHVKHNIKIYPLYKESSVIFVKYTLFYKNKTVKRNYLEGTIYLPFNKRLEFYIGTRLKELRDIDKVSHEYVTREFIDDLKSEGYKYVNLRGYPRIRYAMAFRLKTNKK